MFIAYNTPAYRKLFKSHAQRYAAADHLKDIEYRVREICASVFASDLGVSVWSCEGHDDDQFNTHAGYIMFSPRNRESATILTDVFQRASAALIHRFGWDAGIDIEHDLAMREDTQGRAHSYPCLTIRNNPGMTEYMADLWWASLTVKVNALLKHRIDLQDAIKGAA